MPRRSVMSNTKREGLLAMPDTEVDLIRIVRPSLSGVLIAMTEKIPVGDIPSVRSQRLAPACISSGFATGGSLWIAY